MFEDFSAWPAEIVVGYALENPIQLKAAAAEFRRRPPSEEATMAIVAAFRDGRATASITALFIQAIGHESGYETAHDLLLNEFSAGSSAGPALANIRGNGAFDDLCDALFEASFLPGREGAAAGLGRLGERAIDPVLSSTLNGLIRWQTGAAILAKLGISPQVVSGLLQSDDERSRKVGLEVLWLFIQEKLDQSWLLQEETVFAQPLRFILESPDTNMSPQKRRGLEAWLATLR